jgi:hypothetical protein
MNENMFILGQDEKPGLDDGGEPEHASSEQLSEKPMEAAYLQTMPV